MNPPAFLSATCAGPTSWSRGAPLVCGRATLRPPPRRRPSRLSVVATATKNEEVTVTLTHLPASQVQLDITVPESRTQKIYNTFVSQLAKKADIPGFRKGKAPRQMVINNFGADRVKVSACEEVISAASQEALRAQALNSIGQATLGDNNTIDEVLAAFAPGQQLNFSIKTDVWPDAKLHGDYKAMEVEVEYAEFDEKLVDDALLELRKREALLVTAPDDSALVIGENVGVANLTGFIRNEDGSRGDPLPAIAEGSNVEVKMESGAYFPGFVEGMEGMKVGDVRDVPVDFPENSPRAELRGLKAVFEVTVNAIKTSELPDLDDDFVQRVSEETTVEGLRDEIRRRLQQETDGMAEQRLTKAIEDKLVEMVEVDLPETLIEEQTKNKFAGMMSDFKAQGLSDEQVKGMITKESYEKYSKTARKNVVKQLQGSFGFEAIAKDEGIKVSPEEIEAQMELLRAEAKGEELDEEKSRERIEMLFQKQKVVEFLQEHIVIHKVAPQEVTE